MAHIRHAFAIASGKGDAGKSAVLSVSLRPWPTPARRRICYRWLVGGTSPVGKITAFLSEIEFLMRAN